MILIRVVRLQNQSTYNQPSHPPTRRDRQRGESGALGQHCLRDLDAMVLSQLAKPASISESSKEEAGKGVLAPGGMKQMVKRS